MQHTLRQYQRSTRIVFLIAGLGMSAWAPLVPFAKARAQLDDGALGLLLLGLGLGSIIAMPLTGILTARYGCRTMIIVSGCVTLLALPLLSILSSFTSLAVALMLFGAGIGSLDVAMNIQAVIVERESGRPMMSGFHGLFTVGGIVGAGGLSAFLIKGMPPLAAVLGIVALMAVLLVVAAPHLLPYASRSEGPAFALPHGVVLFLGILAFILFQTEGSILDWSAVALVTIHGLEPQKAGIGYTVFAATMSVGRLTGDFIVHRLGSRLVIAAGAVCAAAGLALAALVPAWEIALLGYGLVGLGCANIVPILFTAAGRQNSMPESAAIPAITTLGYAGILVGPAFIGFLAKATSLPTAFLAQTAILLAVAVSARFIRK